jgi:hypothetical protein
MVIKLANHKFLIVGYRFQVSFKSAKRRYTFMGILGVRELEVTKDSKFHALRILNSDEIRGGASLVMLNKDPDYRNVPIVILIPTCTGITKIKVYILDKDA